MSKKTGKDVGTGHVVEELLDDATLHVRYDVAKAISPEQMKDLDAAFKHIYREELGRLAGGEAGLRQMGIEAKENTDQILKDVVSLAMKYRTAIHVLDVEKEISDSNSMKTLKTYAPSFFKDNKDYLYQLEQYGSKRKGMDLGAAD